jgi:3-hydroxyisobutyrate dehydrogenase
MSAKIGFIGLGKMGGGMSKNLLAHGYSLVVSDIDPVAVDSLNKAGAEAALSPSDVARRSEIIILSLPVPKDVEAVVTGADGILDGATDGTIIIDTSTIDPLTSRKVAQVAAEKNVDMIDAPVAGGGPRGAAVGQQTVIVGGKRQVYDRCHDVLHVLGNQVVYAGGNGQGLAVKLSFNIYGGMCHIAAAEAFAFGVRLGVEPKTLYEVINTARGGDWILENKCPFPNCNENSPADRNFEPEFPIEMAIKDYGLLMSSINALKMPMLMASLTYQMFESAATAGFGNKDVSGISLLVNQLAGLDSKNED